MNIILGDQITPEITDKYIVLELDRFHVAEKDRTVSAFCLVESVPLTELAQADHYRDLHAQLIKNYRLGNWRYCEQALPHLMGRWNSELDSFYQDMQKRLHHGAGQPAADWDPVIEI